MDERFRQPPHESIGGVGRGRQGGGLVAKVNGPVEVSVSVDGFDLEDEERDGPAVSILQVEPRRGVGGGGRGIGVGVQYFVEESVGGRDGSTEGTEGLGRDGRGREEGSVGGDDAV